MDVLCVTNPRVFGMVAVEDNGNLELDFCVILFIIILQYFGTGESSWYSDGLWPGFIPGRGNILIFSIASK
jgi:hypothetical protein